MSLGLQRCGGRLLDWGACKLPPHPHCAVCNDPTRSWSAYIVKTEWIKEIYLRAKDAHERLENSSVQLQME